MLVKEGKLKNYIQLAIDILLYIASFYFAIMLVYSEPLKIFQDYLNIFIGQTIFFFYLNILLKLNRYDEQESLSLISTLIISLIIITSIFYLFIFSFDKLVLIKPISIISLILQIIIFTIHKLLMFKVFNLCKVKRDLIIIDKESNAVEIAFQLLRESSLRYKLKKLIFIKNNQDYNFIRDLKNNDVLFIGDGVNANQREKIVNRCVQYNKNFILVPSLYDISIKGSTTKSIIDIPIQESEILQLSYNQKISKRIFDIVFSLFVIILFSPAFLIISLIIWIEDKNEVLYFQERVTLNNKKFIMYKFRTMKIDAEIESGPVLSIKNDKRTTKVGALLRKYRIDEMPQFFNVLLGDMSIVGPRPERQNFINKYSKNIRHYLYRHNVKAGITGFAQIHSHYGTRPNIKLKYDLIYIRNYSLTLDISIIIQTIRVFVQKLGSSLNDRVGFNEMKMHLKNHQIEMDGDNEI